MSVYIIGQIRIQDREKYNRYVEGFRAQFASVDGISVGGFTGEVLVRDEAFTVLEGEWDYDKTIVMKFNSKTEALDWYNSPNYQKIAQIRYGCSITNLVLATGCD